MASSVSPLGSSNTNSSSSSSAASTANSLTTPNESMFLNLLVAQIQNQDPLNPTDSSQFVSQLAQFSELEQVIAIRGDTDTIAADMQSSATAAANTTTGATTNGTNTAQSNTQTNNASSL